MTSMNFCLQKNDSVHCLCQYGLLRFRQLLIPVLMICLLAGCSDGFNSTDKHTRAVKLPEQQLTDFLLTQCDDIWRLQGEQVELNPVYWLRVIECSQRLDEHRLRQQASQRSDSNWQDVFRRTIVLANAKLQPEQRQLLLVQLDSVSSNVPAAIWPLYQLWRNGQRTQYALAQERNRHRKLQQSTDNEVDRLRQKLQDSHRQLGQITQKLESLTDIERRLSSRKEGYIPPVNRNTDGRNTENKNRTPENNGNKTSPANPPVKTEPEAQEGAKP